MNSARPQQRNSDVQHPAHAVGCKSAGHGVFPCTYLGLKTSVGRGGDDPFEVKQLLTPIASERVTSIGWMPGRIGGKTGQVRVYHQGLYVVQR